MSSPLSTDPIPSTEERATNGRFAKGNPGGPGNPFARQTATLRAYLINHVTERDLQEILEVLLLNAKGGHLPSIKFLFAYVIGKPKPVVEPDLLDLQEMQMLQQGAVPAEALETVCAQLPVEVQVQLTRFSQTENVAAVVENVQEPGPTATPPSAPSTNGNNGEPHGEMAIGEPSTNGEIRRPPKLAGFNWLWKMVSVHFSTPTRFYHFWE